MSRLATGCLDEHYFDFSIINWPPRSPDLNPTEHLWDVYANSWENQTKGSMNLFSLHLSSNCNDISHVSKSCPNHSRGPRCLLRNLYGHKSFECRRANLNNTSTPPGENAMHELPSPINMCKDVTIFGRKLNGFVDTGSNLTLQRNSTNIKINAPPLKQTNTLLTGFGFSRINVIGTFDAEITIDDQIFPVTIYVVPSSCTKYDLIIGCDVIKQAHINISPTGVKFSQILRPSDSANENFIMTISDDSPTFDIGPNVSQHN
ncbi:peptidase A2 domain-containing protein [Trichonephila clavipes]|nr:peptidase A2 domain-containing protein [Trichonephila clavipes]